MVVCPSSLVSNWAAEFDKWVGRASQPKCVIINKGDEEGLQQMKAFNRRGSNQPLSKVQSGQVLIVSYELLRRHAGIFQNLRDTENNCKSNNSFGLLVVDEGHRLKNTKGSHTLTALESLPVDARLCITATPIQNNLSEFYTLANFACPNILGDLSTFRREYERPIAASSNKTASREEREIGLCQSMKLESMSKCFMLRRLQKDILKDMLPTRTEILLFCRPSLEQRTLYHKITRGMINESSQQDALTALTSLRKVCSHPSLDHHHRIEEESKVTKHLASVSRTVEVSGKLKVLNALLDAIRRTDPDDKVIIVSNFTSALDIIEEAILKTGGSTSVHDLGGNFASESCTCQFSFLRLDGSVDNKKRKSIVDSFNMSSTKSSFCLLLSAKAGGCGLNLVGANRIVLFDPDWNPATDIQVMGRIYRQGQKKPCTIYRMFTAGTVEEVIYQRQSQKGDLSTLTVDGAIHGHGLENGLRFSKEELADCFSLKENCDCDTKNKIGKHWPAYEVDNPITSLEAEGCFDMPIHFVASTCQETLRFVHVVKEKISIPIGTTTDVGTLSRIRYPVVGSLSIVHEGTEENESDASSVVSTSEEEFEL
jgi:SNF2 family DNA or RNA helicase